MGQRLVSLSIGVFVPMHASLSCSLLGAHEYASRTCRPFSFVVHNVQAAIEASALKQQLNAIFQDMPQDLQATMLSSPHRAALMQGSGPHAQVRAIHCSPLSPTESTHDLERSWCCSLVLQKHLCGIAAHINLACTHASILHVHMHLSYMYTCIYPTCPRNAPQ